MHPLVHAVRDMSPSEMTEHVSHIIFSATIKRVLLTKAESQDLTPEEQQFLNANAIRLVVMCALHDVRLAWTCLCFLGKLTIIASEHSVYNVEPLRWQDVAELVLMGMQQLARRRRWDVEPLEPFAVEQVTVARTHRRKGSVFYVQKTRRFVGEVPSLVMAQLRDHCTGDAELSQVTRSDNECFNVAMGLVLLLRLAGAAI